MSQEPSSFAALQALLRKKPPAAPGERCDYCATAIGPEHGHLIDLKARRILCSCRPCQLVFEPQGAAQGRYKSIPSRYLEIADIAIDDAQWDALQIPIGLAFLFFNSQEQKTAAFYPGPAGATESLLSLDTWDEIAAANPAFATLEPDVEAILIRRPGGARSGALARTECFIVPIDVAYELVGLMRTTWRGFDGGEEAWARLDAFFAKIRRRSLGEVATPLT